MCCRFSPLHGRWMLHQECGFLLLYQDQHLWIWMHVYLPDCLSCCYGRIKLKSYCLMEPSSYDNSRTWIKIFYYIILWNFWIYTFCIMLRCWGRLSFWLQFYPRTGLRPLLNPLLIIHGAIKTDIRHTLILVTEVCPFCSQEETW